eukprot:GHVP01025358.1.p1 GENE.GHVP01025358.1~~GHVP01025358.1.p1  ORF type:complete len:277 (+),score=28.38 GHVP01025358.1:1502-2332(+)
MPVLGEEEITVFRTKACRRHSTPKANLPTPIDKLSPSCRFGQNCYFSHNAQWLRRVPFLLTTPQTSLRYIHYLCPDVILPPVLQKAFVAVRLGCGKKSHLLVRSIHFSEFEVALKSSCRLGSSCPYSHSMDEVVFHPLLYKTLICRNFSYSRSCILSYCPFIHALEEQRIPEKILQQKNCYEFFLPYTHGAELPDFLEYIKCDFVSTMTHSIPCQVYNEIDEDSVFGDLLDSNAEEESEASDSFCAMVALYLRNRNTEEREILTNKLRDVLLSIET